jgi:hypothetical protein
MRLFSITLIIGGLLGLVGVSQAGEPKSKVKGTLTLDGTTYRLTSALAYEQTVFGKKETVVLLSEKPIDTTKLMQSLKKNGNDDDFFPTQVYVKLSLDGMGELLQLHVHAGGANILRSGDRNILAKATFQNATAKGSARMKKADTFRDKPFDFDAEFEVSVIGATGVAVDPKPAREPITETPPKTTAGQPQPALEKDVRIEGALANNSPKVQGKPAQIHKLKMSPGKTYIIDLESTDFDTYLRVLDSRGKELAKDDDSGEKLNARIRFTPPKEDTYQIVATRFGSGQGNYLLKVRVERPALEKQPAGPVLVLTDKEHQFEGRLAQNSAQVLGKPAQVHTVKMTADKTYVVDLESTDFDPYLRILDAAGKQLAEDDDSGGNLNARIRFTAPKDGNFQIVATRFGNGQGNYRLKIRTE